MTVWQHLFLLGWLQTKCFKSFNVSLANDDILFLDEDFSQETFFATEMGIVNKNLDKINLDGDNNFYEGDSETNIYIRLLAWRNKFKKGKAFKKI